MHPRAWSRSCCSLQFIFTSFFLVPMSCAQGALITLSDLHGDQDGNQLYGHMILEEKNDIKGSYPPESCGSTAELQAGKSGLRSSYDMLGTVSDAAHKDRGAGRCLGPQSPCTSLYSLLHPCMSGQDRAQQGLLDLELRAPL